MFLLVITIIVSPIALDTANNRPPIIPGNAAGIITFLIVSDLVAPIPREPSFKFCGTAFITSSEIDETNGIIIIPITNPAASALSEAIANPNSSPVFLIKGATTITSHAQIGSEKEPKITMKK